MAESMTNAIGRKSDTNVFDTVSSSLEQVEAYTDESYNELSSTMNNAYDGLHDSVIGELNNTPNNAVSFIDKNTSIVTTMDTLNLDLSTLAGLDESFKAIELELEKLNTTNHQMQINLTVL